MLTRRDFVATGIVAAMFQGSAPAYGAATAWPEINPVLLRRARAALETKRRQLRHVDRFAIADFSRRSGEQRFHIVDTASGKVRSYHVAHGRGSDPAHSGFVQRFSDDPGSNASSAGAYVTGDFYHGKYGRSLRLKGLDHTNRHAEVRNIVVHSAPYAEPSILQQFGKLGRSEGCFAFSRQSHLAVMEQLGSGRLIYCDKA